jgi:endogenous inhibitor of DNA gyrase (YacG/DUF329 family)
MARIMIRCPETGKAVHTRLIADKKTWETSNIWQRERFLCPECKKQHTWSKEDAFLDETLDY